MFNEIIKKIDWNGEILELSTGKIARQADGAVMVKMGNSVVLCTTVSDKSVKEGTNFFPLTVNYLERTYAAGRIPGGFLKREGKGTEREVLVSRLIDRPIRPLFHPSFFNETQVVCTVHSYDPNHNTDILALIGASAALAISGVPYRDIAAGCRVGFINDEFILNPSAEQFGQSKLDLIVAGTESSVMMVESEADFLTEKQMLDAVKFGHQSLQPVIALIKDLVKEAGKPKWEISEFLFPSSLKEEIRNLTKEDIEKAFAIQSKQERYTAIATIYKSMMERFNNDGQYSELQISSALEEVKYEVLRTDTLSKKIRIDGRKAEDIRPIECEVTILPNTHGSALFTRGETQSIVLTTLGTAQDEQIIDSLDGEYKEPFLLNYLFPPYSVGEALPLRAPSRREVGHGKLAWRALKRAIPTKEHFPYTVRVVSEITESNGSSSMATVCGASMSMMDAGVPLKAPIAGIAMGLIKEGKEFIVLSDIIADEDYLGDMDFKVAGSDQGVTALQMDIKVSGITFDIMEKALEQAQKGRIHILDKMSSAISISKSVNDNAPMIISFKVNKDKIREIIGPGGKVIREICDSTGAKIDITDDGNVSIAAVGKEKLEAAVKRVKEIAFDPEVGDIFEGTVVKVLESGAFVNYLGSRDGFVHISEIAHERIGTVSEVLSEGQKVRVKLIGFDRGKGKLTIKNVEAELPQVSNGEPTEKSQKPNGKNKRSHSSSAPKREGAKKWKKANSETEESDIRERKYFN